MCGRYASPDDRALEAYYRIDRRNSGDWARRFNVAPTTQVPILLQAEDGAIELHSVRWGLIPHWWSQPKPPNLTFNARSEEAWQKPMWRDSLRYRRCIMPALGWYEWNENEPAVSPSGKKCNQPYFHIDPTREVISIAGIWTTWQSPAGSTILSCALLSREACKSVAGIHHRMPVVLNPEQERQWLEGQLPQEIINAVIGTPAKAFETRRVSTQVNSSRVEGAELIVKV